MRLINLSNRTYKTWMLIILTMIIGAVLAGCAATRQARDVEMSDFLGIDPSMLSTGEKGQALLVYRNKTVDIAAYDTIMLDPVTVWWGIEVKKEMDLEDLQVLADNFYKLLYAELSEDYKIVGEPAGNTLRIQFAITNANKRSPRHGCNFNGTSSWLCHFYREEPCQRETLFCGRGERRSGYN